jgi:hypothetical protein
VFDRDLFSQGVSVRGLGELDAIDRPSAQRFDDAFAASVVASPEHAARGIWWFPDGPLVAQPMFD